jgi:hypothetical protein
MTTLTDVSAIQNRRVFTSEDEETRGAFELDFGVHVDFLLAFPTPFYAPVAVTLTAPAFLFELPKDSIRLNRRFWDLA